MKKIILALITISNLSCIIRDEYDKIYYWSISDDTAVCQIGYEAKNKISKFLSNSNKIKGISIEPINNGNAILFYIDANYWMFRSSDDIKYIQLDYPISWVSESGKILAWWDRDNNKVVFPEGNTIYMPHIGARERFLIYFESGGQYFALKDDSSEKINVYENNKNLDKIITLTHSDRIFVGKLRLFSQNNVLYCIYTSRIVENNTISDRSDLVVHKINLTDKEPSHSIMYLSESEDHYIFNPYCHDFYGNRELIFLIDSTSLKDPPLLRTRSRYYMWDLKNGNVYYLRNFNAAPLVLNKSLLYDLAIKADIDIKYVGSL